MPATTESRVPQTQTIRAKSAVRRRRLFERGRNRSERRVQARAETLDCDDDGNRDAGGDQAVFDSCGRRFVAQEAFDLLHGMFLTYTGITCPVRQQFY